MLTSSCNAQSWLARCNYLFQDSGLLWAYYDFDAGNSATDTLVLRVATSFISPAQAAANYAAEVAGQPFESVAAAAKAAWHGIASRVSVEDVGPGRSLQETSDLLTVFYSSLYRASKYPRSFSEVEAGTGRVVHYSPYTGTVVPGELRSALCGGGRGRSPGAPLPASYLSPNLSPFLSQHGRRLLGRLPHDRLAPLPREPEPPRRYCDWGCGGAHRGSCDGAHPPTSLSQA